MRPQILPASLLAILAFGTTSASALDCKSASTGAEKLVCSDAKLRDADKAMSAAYFKLVKKATDEDSRAALLASQKRWLKARDDEFEAPAKNDNGEERDDHALMLRILTDRTKGLSASEGGQPQFLAVIAQQKKAAASITGGPFSGFDTSCFFAPAGFGDGVYVCTGTQSYQNNDRVCATSSEWASGQGTETRSISTVSGGQLKPVATCEAGASTPACPEMGARWTLTPDTAPSASAAKPAALAKYDPDVSGLSLEDTPWLKACLTDPNYPPPQ